MADKSAFVPVDAIGNHKNTDLDVDIDDELFGKKPPSSMKPATPPPPPPPPVKAATPPPPAAKPASPGGRYAYKKPATYMKTFAK